MPDIQLSATAVAKALKPLLGESVQELAALIADEVRLWRWSRQLKIVDRASRILTERSIEPKPVHLKILVPLLDAASLEEEPELEEMWSKLLASASEDSSEKTFYFVATEILKNISSNEAAILNWMYDKWKVRAADAPLNEGSGEIYISTSIINFQLKEILSVSNLPFKKGLLLADNLMRLNLIWHDHRRGGQGAVLTQGLVIASSFQLTQLSLQLMEVCGKTSTDPKGDSRA